MQHCDFNIDLSSELMTYPCLPTGQYVFFESEEVKFKKTSRLWRNFLKFHNRNPHAYENFRKNMLECMESGDTISARLEAESTRWDPNSYGDGKNLNINNNYVPYAIRMFIEEFPQYYDRFVLRPLKDD